MKLQFLSSRGDTEPSGWWCLPVVSAIFIRKQTYVQHTHTRIHKHQTHTTTFTLTESQQSSPAVHEPEHLTLYTRLSFQLKLCQQEMLHQLKAVVHHLISTNSWSLKCGSNLSTTPISNLLSHHLMCFCVRQLRSPRQSQSPRRDGRRVGPLLATRDLKNKTTWQHERTSAGT